MKIYNYNGEPISINETYNCTEYGITEESSDNSQALRDLVSLVSNNGGGIIYVPVGTYIFDTSRWNDWIVQMQDNVSVIGESMYGSVFKIIGNTQLGKIFMMNKSGVGTNNPLRGCTFANMTYDASESSASSYSFRGKCFMFSYVKDCVFRDLRLIGFVATALGIDQLDNVIMDSIYCYNCGKQWSSGGTGGAGIGIGTGQSGWDHENFIIRNCILDSCGHFGIFIEDQGMFRSPTSINYPKGQIIANNIVRNGRNYGIGIRGGRYVNVTGNNIYSNANGGIYLDYGADQIMISDNLISDEVRAVNFGNESTAKACTKVVITNNTFAGCTNGIVETLTPTDCVYQNNATV